MVSYVANVMLSIERVDRAVIAKLNEWMSRHTRHAEGFVSLMSSPW
jgi:hypothetical protein